MLSDNSILYVSLYSPLKVLCSVCFLVQNLKIIDLQQPDFLRTLENSVQFGNPVLLQNVQEELDPSLGPILNKSLIKKGNRVIIKLGDKEVDFNPDFKFYITTKLSNPHYTPEISTKTVIVNFAVKEQGELIVTYQALYLL